MYPTIKGKGSPYTRLRRILGGMGAARIRAMVEEWSASTPHGVSAQSWMGKQKRDWIRSRVGYGSQGLDQVFTSSYCAAIQRERLAAVRALRPRP